MCVTLGDCQSIVEHREGDFDFRRYLSRIFFYATVIPLHLHTLYAEPPIGILAYLVQDREEWLLNRSGIHPQNAPGNCVDAHILDLDLSQISAPLV
jgi:hypothetical protein